MHVEPTMDKGWKPHVEISPTCPRCGSLNTKFCYYNNYSLTQPRYFCKACRRYWTKGGSLRNVPVGGGCRKTRRSGRPHIAGGGRIATATTTSLSPSPSIAKRDDHHHHGSSIDLALVYANFLNQKPRANVNDQNSSPPDQNHNHHHHHQMEIPMLPFGGGNCGLMSFQFPYPLMSAHVNGTFLEPLSAYGHHHHHHHQSSDAHFSGAFDHHHDKQADYHQFMMNNSSVENVTNNPMTCYNLPPLPGDEELNILWSDSSNNNNLVFPNSNTNSALGHNNASQHDHDQFASRLVHPQQDATVEEPKQLGEINLPVELCNFLGLE